MTTISRPMPLAARLGAIGGSIFSEGMQKAEAAFRTRRGRPLHDVSDWILKDIGLMRLDIMSPEARRAMNRLHVNTLW
jgi:uncharacterized protein YjiS (DUF1127 family)